MKDYENIAKDIGSNVMGYGTFGVFLAFLGGAVAGAATALLFAPSPGDETRRQIKHMANRAKERVKKAPGQLREAANVAQERIGAAYEGASEGASGTRH